MSGRREQTRLETRARVIEAAKDLFAAHGVSGTTAADLARAARISRATFFNYFGSKEELLVALWSEQVGNLGAQIGEALAADLGTAQRIRGLFTHLLEALERRPGYLEVVASELERASSVESMAARSSLFHQHVRRIIAAGIEQGDVRSDHDPDELTEVVADLYIGVLRNLRLDVGYRAAQRIPAVADLAAEVVGGTAGSTDRAAVLRDLVTERHSCRAFRSDPVPTPVIEEILEVARRTPSWCNTQPWQVHLVGGAALAQLRVDLREYAVTQPQTPDIPFPAAYHGVHRERRKECALQLYRSVGVPEGDRTASATQALENFNLFGAPHLAVLTAPAELGTYGTIDVGLYVGSFLLAAQSLGVATVPQAALAGCAPLLRQRLTIPADRQVVVGISFGYADPSHPANDFRTRRASLTDTITWHQEALA